MLFQNEFFLLKDGMNFQRDSYNIMDVIGDIAGIYELIKMIFGFILYRVSEHSFVLTAIRSLFLINTEDKELFDDQIINTCNS